MTVPKIGKQAECQPLEYRDVALIRNKDLEHHAQNAREYAIEEMLPFSQ